MYNPHTLELVMGWVRIFLCKFNMGLQPGPPSQAPIQTGIRPGASKGFK